MKKEDICSIPFTLTNADSVKGITGSRMQYFPQGIMGLGIMWIHFAHRASQVHKRAILTEAKSDIRVEE